MQNQLADRIFAAYLDNNLDGGSPIPDKVWDYYIHKRTYGSPVRMSGTVLPKRSYASTPCPIRTKKLDLGIDAADDAFWATGHLTHDVIYNYKDGVDLVIID